MEQTSTPPSPFSSSFLRRGETPARHRSVLKVLCMVSSIKPYATLPYFRCIFATGMLNLEERQQADVNINDTKGALRSCFGINKNMMQVITAATAAVVALMATEGGHPSGGGRDVSVPTTTTTWQGSGEGVERPRIQWHNDGVARKVVEQ